MSERTGGCLCGAVRFTARDVPVQAGICHCRMCQRWVGGPYVEVNVAEDNLTWEGADRIGVYASSHLAERAFCTVCGSAVWFRVTQEGEWSGDYALPLGTFDDTSGFELRFEIYTDHAPTAYGIQDYGQARLTRQQVLERFPGLAEVGP